ncbi:uncharacterized protein LOC108436110 [Pygocentrus nattereri]|uniref:uncharacterized protein LOC108436110 n=1 Tax=Pygocentrus nattereri TaxID=42514 RepID=UPI001890DEB5|nr:uncharacterized protein LOC108436110 [Pygocentrus nattereri]
MAMKAENDDLQRTQLGHCAPLSALYLKTKLIREITDPYGKTLLKKRKSDKMTYLANITPPIFIQHIDSTWVDLSRLPHVSHTGSRKGPKVKHTTGPNLGQKLTTRQRFRLTATEETFDLKIMNTVEEDTGTYFCVKVKEYVTEFGSGILLLFPDEKSEKRNLTEVDVKSGESVTLQCSVAPLSCSGEHSVYWIRHGSGESHPGIIYTHGDTDSPCTRSSETDSPTQSCVYKLPKRNLSLSDAGTYYCAVAACGQILFGNGTELNVKEDNIWIFALTTTNVITLTVTIILAVLLFKNQRKGCFTDHPNHTNQVANTDALNYAALNFAKKPPPSRTSRVKERQDIYSQVKLR